MIFFNYKKTKSDFFVILFITYNFALCSQNNLKTFKLTDASFQVGSYLRTYSVLFDHDKSNIKIKSFPFLDSVVVFLTINKHVSIEISNHNTREIEIYSRSITRDRSEAIKKYLVEKGIDKNRLTSKGYGSSKPIIIETKGANKSKKIKHAESVNQRTEFLIAQTDFVEQQKIDSVLPQKLLGTWQAIKLTENSAAKMIAFKMQTPYQLVLVVDSLFTYSFGNSLSKTKLFLLGYKANWPPYYCFVKEIDDNTIQIDYSRAGAQTDAVIYKRKE